MSWCLYHLADSPLVQQRLREECASYGENISMEDLDALPLLDMVVKEVYRLNPSIPTTVSPTAIFGKACYKNQRCLHIVHLCPRSAWQ